MAERHFVVIGGTKGAGRNLVDRLVANADARVSVFGRTAARGARTSRTMRYQVDVTDRPALVKSLDEAVETFGKIDCVVFMQRHRGGEEDFDMDLAVSLSATRNAIEHLAERRFFSDDGPSNSIILVSSVADAYVGPEQPAGYHVAKAGLSQLARYYAVKLGPLGVRVNSISPCVVAKDESRAYYAQNRPLVDRFAKLIPLGRMGKPDDVINAVLFLSSEQASYITGQNIRVDGGLTLRSHESLIRDLAEYDDRTT